MPLLILDSITAKYLRDLCKEMKQYTTPELNDILYLHYKGLSPASSICLLTRQASPRLKTSRHTPA
jgi:hypothetical protein